MNETQQTRSELEENAEKSTMPIGRPPLITVWSQVRVLPAKFNEFHSLLAQHPVMIDNHQYLCRSIVATAAAAQIRASNATPADFGNDASPEMMKTIPAGNAAIEPDPATGYDLLLDRVADLVRRPRSSSITNKLINPQSQPRLVTRSPLDSSRRFTT
ncbi:hypothetical protein [Bradyrhizobium sp. SZCCHNR1051]|uniref:hypothetical protein n=1 Tax=Bradyrhizobium sp. SZCCHNR1051 TaxID=3057355 RepID=UPI002916789F|nr:hypothetical protein [Bradyrhizobium sp. SZCCHNR1051]